MDPSPLRNKAPGFPEQSYRLGLRLAEVSRLWRAAMDQRVRHLGLSTARWVTLANLNAHPEGMTQNELAIRVGIKGSTLVRQLDLLEADGWVERRESPTDRRAKRVFVTAKAKPALERISEVGGDLRRELLAGVDESEIRACIALLDNLKDRLQSMSVEDAAEEAA